MVQRNNNYGDTMNPTESILIRHLRELPIPASDRARAVAEFERAERVVDAVAELIGGVRRRFAAHRSSQPLKLRTAAR